MVPKTVGRGAFPPQSLPAVFGGERLCWYSTTVFPAKFFTPSFVLAGSPPRGGDVAVYVFTLNQPSLSTPFFSSSSVLVSISVVWPFQLYFMP